MRLGRRRSTTTVLQRVGSRSSAATSLRRSFSPFRPSATTSQTKCRCSLLPFPQSFSRTPLHYFSLARFARRPHCPGMSLGPKLRTSLPALTTSISRCAGTRTCSRDRSCTGSGVAYRGVRPLNPLRSSHSVMITHYCFFVAILINFAVLKCHPLDDNPYDLNSLFFLVMVRRLFSFSFFLIPLPPGVRGRFNSFYPARFL